MKPTALVGYAHTLLCHYYGGPDVAAVVAVVPAAAAAAAAASSAASEFAVFAAVLFCAAARFSWDLSRSPSVFIFFYLLSQFNVFFAAFLKKSPNPS